MQWVIMVRRTDGSADNFTFTDFTVATLFCTVLEQCEEVEGFTATLHNNDRVTELEVWQRS